MSFFTALRSLGGAFHNQMMSDEDKHNAGDGSKLTGDIATRRKKILYRAEHRGTKELDYLLGRYAQANVNDIDGKELDLFEAFLSLPEPDIERMIMMPEISNLGEFGDLVSAVRKFHGLDSLEK